MGKKRKRSGEGKESSASEGEEPAPKARPSSPKRFKPAVEGELMDRSQGRIERRGHVTLDLIEHNDYC